MPFVVLFCCVVALNGSDRMIRAVVKFIKESKCKKDYPNAHKATEEFCSLSQSSQPEAGGACDGDGGGDGDGDLGGLVLPFTPVEQGELDAILDGVDSNNSSTSTASSVKTTSSTGTARSTTTSGTGGGGVATSNVGGTVGDGGSGGVVRSDVDAAVPRLLSAQMPDGRTAYFSGAGGGRGPDNEVTIIDERGRVGGNFLCLGAGMY